MLLAGALVAVLVRRGWPVLQRADLLGALLLGGALGCVGFGVGTTDMANAFVTGAVRLTLPPDCAWT